MANFKAVAVFTAFENRPSGLVGFMTTEDHCKSGLVTGFALNSSMPKAAMVAAERMAQVCRAVGVMSFNDTDELLHKPFLVEYRNDMARAGFYVVGVKPLTTTRVEYLKSPGFFERMKARFAAWRASRNQPDDFGDDWGYDDY